MTHITAHQLTTIARIAREEEPADRSARARIFFARLLGLLTDAENDRLAIAMGFDHLTTAASAALNARYADHPDAARAA